MKLEIAELANNPMGFLMEAVHTAGFSGALANPLYAPESALDRLNGELLEEFMTVSPHQLLSIFYISVITLVYVSYCPLCIFHSFDLWISGEFHCFTYGTGSKWC